MSAHSSPVYSKYWQRKELLKKAPHFANVRSWPSSEFSDIEELYWKELKTCNSILDVGAGDLRFMNKLIAKGYDGEYHTMDIGEEYSYTYSNLDAVNRTYQAIVCFDVIEHLKLEDGLCLLQRLIGLLDSSGILIVQTPNSRCIRHPSSWDMTHVHCYNASDLWAFLTSQGTQTKGYRVTFTYRSTNVFNKLQALIAKVIITRFLGGDFADNIALVARRIV